MNFSEEDEERMRLHLSVLSDLLEIHCGLSDLQKILLNLYMDLPIDKIKTTDLLQSPVIMEITGMRKMIKVANLVKQFIKHKALVD